MSHIPGGMIEPEILGIFGRAVTVAYTFVNAVLIITVLKRLCPVIAIRVYPHHCPMTVSTEKLHSFIVFSFSDDT